MKGHAQAFDAAAVAGSGTVGQPIGLLNRSGITVIPLGTNGAAATYANICDLEAALANSNAPDDVAWLTTPNVRKLLRKAFVNGTGSVPVWTNGTVLGKPATVSTAVPGTLSKGTSVGNLSAIVAGVFPEMRL